MVEKILVEKILIEKFSEKNEKTIDEKKISFFVEFFVVGKLGVQRCRNNRLELYSMILSELGVVASKNVQGR